MLTATSVRGLDPRPVPAGGISDWLGRRGPLLVTAADVAAFLLAYLVFAVSGLAILVRGIAFALAGVGIGCTETAEHPAVAASAIAGLLYTVASPTVASTYLATGILLALIILGWTFSSDRRPAGDLA